MIESPADWAVFTDPEVFGAPVTYTGEGQAPLEIAAIFTAAGTVAAQGSGPGVSSTEPVLTLGADQLPFTPARGDRVALIRAQAGFPAGTAFTVVHPQPDGSGLIRLILERN
jgi:hypothetical protein